MKIRKLLLLELLEFFLGGMTRGSSVSGRKSVNIYKVINMSMIIFKLLFQQF